MPEFLESRADKFTFRVATDRYYTPEGIWVLPESPTRVRLGFTDFLQQRSGDVAAITVQPTGTHLVAGDDFAELETVKVTQGAPSPVSGTVVEANPALALTPGVVNEDPYGKGWLVVVDAPAWEAERRKLLDAHAYQAAMQSQIEQEAGGS
jgi:glycine cleavage system H protein